MIELGKTGVLLSNIGLGTWQFASTGFSKYTWDSIKQEEINNIVKVAINRGINWFDTAEKYGESEQHLSSALISAGYETPIIMTKWNPNLRFANSITKTVDNRINNLAPYRITLFQIHNSHSLSSIKTQMDVMLKLVHTNKIKYVGVSNFTADQMETANRRLLEYGISLVSNQFRYNLLKRSAETNEVLDACRELSITPICYSPLEKGLLSGKYHFNPQLINSLPLLRRIKFKMLIKETFPLINVMSIIATVHSCSISNVAMSWLINEHKVLVLTGVQSVKQLLENMKSLTIKLNEDELDGIDTISKRLKLIYV